MYIISRHKILKIKNGAIPKRIKKNNNFFLNYKIKISSENRLCWEFIFEKKGKFLE